MACHPSRSLYRTCRSWARHITASIQADTCVPEHQLFNKQASVRRGDARTRTPRPAVPRESTAYVDISARSIRSAIPFNGHELLPSSPAPLSHHLPTHSAVSRIQISECFLFHKDQIADSQFGSQQCGGWADVSDAFWYKVNKWGRDLGSPLLSPPNSRNVS